ncbi:hypothetical protein [uncultured Psychroserpens sp.]|uniref:hypothetical protein n=1 Tax=uncultured Psychroserpens sp. TaxID=255436 RepID=UPI00261578B9|nr:hypothetical protein [uncultured Psychroserpens sp.]
MKNTGIWIDKEKAHIVFIKDEKETLKTISSNIEHYRPHGGSGTRFKGGPQDVVQDSKYSEREKHQLKNYFKNIAAEIKDADRLVIFGPAGTNEKLYNELRDSYKALSAKVKGVKKADSMTNNQVIAWVRHFFESN